MARAFNIFLKFIEYINFFISIAGKIITIKLKIHLKSSKNKYFEINKKLARIYKGELWIIPALYGARNQP